MYIRTYFSIVTLSDKIRKAESEKETLKAADVFKSESEEEYSSGGEGSDTYQQDTDDEAGTK